METTSANFSSSAAKGSCHRAVFLFFLADKSDFNRLETWHIKKEAQDTSSRRADSSDIFSSLCSVIAFLTVQLYLLAAAPVPAAKSVKGTKNSLITGLMTKHFTLG